MNVLLLLGAVVSGVVWTESRRRGWALLLVSACLARMAARGLDHDVSAERGGGAGGVCRGRIHHAGAGAAAARGDAGRALQACARRWMARFLRFAGATFSVLLGIYLFTNADRIIALGWIREIHVGEACPSAPRSISTMFTRRPGCSRAGCSGARSRCFGSVRRALEAGQNDEWPR
jgi:hypothetical protein